MHAAHKYRGHRGIDGWLKVLAAEFARRCTWEKWRNLLLGLVAAHIPVLQRKQSAKSISSGGSFLLLLLHTPVSNMKTNLTLKYLTSSFLRSVLGEIWKADGKWCIWMLLSLLPDTHGLQTRSGEGRNPPVKHQRGSVDLVITYTAFSSCIEVWHLTETDAS